MTLGIEELGMATVKPRIIQEDSQACIWYSEHPGSYEKIKRIMRPLIFYAPFNFLCAL